ncbi:hypothetical protein AAG906_015211 [Vitis piasezkii]
MRQNFHSSRLLTPHLHLLLLSSRLLQPYYLYHCLFHQLRLHNLHASSSSSLTNPSAPHNSHPRITRARTGIFKKKLLLAHKPTEPYSFQQASKDPNWVSAMETEYKALIQNHT